MARKYSNTFAETTLTGSISNSATTIQIGSTTGLPASFPYTLAIDYGTSAVEMVTVTALAGSNLTVTRGQDGTTAQSHTAGARVVHPVSARDLSEPQVHIDATSDIHGLSGGASVVGTTQTQTLTNKTISGSNNTITNIPNTALVAIDASKVTQPFATMTVTGANGAAQVVTVTGSEVTRTKPIASWLRSTLGLTIDEDAVVDVNSDLNVGTVRASGASALTARIAVLATSKIGMLITRVAANAQDLFQIVTEGAANLFKVSSTGAVTAAASITAGTSVTAGTSLNGATLATTGNGTVGGTLGVTGLLTASGGVSVTGGVTATGALSGASAAITGGITTGTAGVSVASEVFTALTLANSWVGTLKYRRVPSPPNSIQVIGTLTPGTKTDGTVIATLPSGYRPTTAQDIFGSAGTGTLSTTQSVHFNVQTDGTILCYGIGSAVNAQINGIVTLDYA